MKGSTRRKLYSIHRWLGVHVGLLLFVICFTGTLAVLGHEWDELFDDALHVETTEMNWDAVENSVHQSFPLHRVETIMAPRKDGRPATVFLHGPRDQYQNAYFEPETGELTGQRPLFSIQFYLRQYHQNLLVPRGLYIIGLLGFVLAFFGVTGLLIYKKWWKHLFRFRIQKNAHLRWTDLHRTGGVWMSIFALIIALTGTWYWIERVAKDAGNVHFAVEHPHLSAERLQGDDVDGYLPASDYVEVAKRALPDLQVKAVSYPHEPDEPIRVTGQTGAALVRDWANQVYIDPYNGELLSAIHANDLSLVNRWNNTVNELHFGTFGVENNLGLKILYFILGLGLSGVILAGSLLAIVRTANSRKKQNRATWPAFIPIVATGLLVIASIAFTIVGYQNPLITGDAPADRLSPQTRAVGNSFTVAQYVDGENGRYVLHWLEGPPVKVASARLVVGEQEAAEMYGWKRSTVRGPSDDEATVVLELHDGTRIQKTVSFQPRETFSEDMPLLQVQTLEPQRYAKVFMIGLLILVVLSCIGWFVFLWKPLALPKEQDGQA